MKKEKLEDIDIHDLYEFMEHGSMQNAPDKIREYVELLDKVRGMYLRIDRYGSPDAIIKHLITIEGLSRLKAKKIYEETLEYFYCDSHVSKAAYRNIYADKIDKMINFSMLTVKDPSDAAKVVKMVVDAANVRALDEPDKEELPEELFNQPIKVYTADAASLGLPVANRSKLKELIESLPELTEKERQRMMQEADIDKTFKMFPNDEEDPRKH
ncbi:MAG: hypothetical protein BM557_01280 [Flavobacterium sp. MedPE-SWcel]|uniref:hypothetical protein n=1 Tax=uncultured Flavobacterium sp. TaxID=165435 RepID=UPI00090F0032|nr:hypothetical protein [uncultured Flavobacterium sp.]OIQ22039.1 MAG: hypothetical protein BM557_01280 [Flavobacterium sp. MedPE-SWcel]